MPTFYTGVCTGRSPVTLLGELVPSNILENVRDISIQRNSAMLKREAEQFMPEDMLNSFGAVWRLAVVVDNGSPEEEYFKNHPFWGTS